MSLKQDVNNLFMIRWTFLALARPYYEYKSKRRWWKKKNHRGYDRGSIVMKAWCARRIAMQKGIPVKELHRYASKGGAYFDLRDAYEDLLTHEERREEAKRLKQYVPSYLWWVYGGVMGFENKIEIKVNDI